MSSIFDKPTVNHLKLIANLQNQVAKSNKKNIGVIPLKLPTPMPELGTLPTGLAGVQHRAYPRSAYSTQHIADLHAQAVGDAPRALLRITPNDANSLGILTDYAGSKPVRQVRLLRVLREDDAV